MYSQANQDPQSISDFSTRQVGQIKPFLQENPASCPLFWGGFESTLLARQLHQWQERTAHKDGGAVIRKPGSAWLAGTPAISIVFMFCFMIVVLK